MFTDPMFHDGILQLAPISQVHVCNHKHVPIKHQSP